MQPRPAMVRAAALIFGLLAAPIGSERIAAGNGNAVDLATFECRDIDPSSFVQRVCYDSAQRTLLIAVRGNYQHYCGVPMETFDALMHAPSIGLFVNRVLRIAGADGRYACRA